ncbi:MAG: gamma-glutamyltransferase [Balneolales bacterium]|nr:gamma-glutamyltransferase [Balneolales bacterium]
MTLFNIRLLQAGLVLAAIIFVGSTWFGSPSNNSPDSKRDTKFAEGREAMVATAHPEVSKIAWEILEQGGNAVDAAIAAAYALGVYEPTGSGIGGGGTAIIYMKDQNEFFNIDFYPRSPANPITSFNPTTDASTVKAVSIPGFVAGMEELRERWAVLDREALIRPSIQVARNGFIPDSVTHSFVRISTDKAAQYDESRAIFTNNGQRISRDFIIKNPALADVMEQVIDGGAPAFYNSDLTLSIIDKLNDLGGQFELSDFNDYEALWYTPSRGSYRGYDVISAAPPQAGLLVIQSLHMMETFDFEENGHYTQSPQSMHFLFEMFKRSFADRLSFIGDPRFVDVPAPGLASKAYAQSRVTTINMAAADPVRLRDTEPGNPFGFRASSGRTGLSDMVVSQPLVPWGDDMDDEASSFDWWGDDTFDSWGVPRRDRSNRPNLLQRIFNRNNSDTTDLAPIRIEDDDDWDVSEVNETTTSHITIIDKDGNMVSLTSTVGLYLGSGITVNGVVMNSGQANFGSTNPVNIMVGGRTPRSTIAPTILMDGDRPFLILGAAGGARIPAAIVLAIHNIVDFNMDAYEANAAPRFISRRWADNIEIEGHMPYPVVDAMRRRGHPIQMREPMHSFFGGLQIIHVREDGVIEGASDPRRDGVPLGR